MQITVFEHDGRFPVQFELGGITQIYRFRKGEALSNIGHLRQYVDQAFREAVLAQFKEMQRVQAGVLRRIQSVDDPGGDLPRIL